MLQGFVNGVTGTCNTKAITSKESTTTANESTTTPKKSTTIPKKNMNQREVSTKWPCHSERWTLTLFNCLPSHTAEAAIVNRRQVGIEVQCGSAAVGLRKAQPARKTIFPSLRRSESPAQHYKITSHCFIPLLPSIPGPYAYTERVNPTQHHPGRCFLGRDGHTTRQLSPTASHTSFSKKRRICSFLPFFFSTFSGRKSFFFFVEKGVCKVHTWAPGSTELLLKMEINHRRLCY